MRLGLYGILGLGLLVSACTTDFQLEADWKDIPIVNGFLNQADTAHYIRVEKAFLEPGGNAEEIAQIADSLYYDDSRITVELERVSTGERFRMRRVDGNLEGYVRDEGPFAQSPNYLYKINRTEINLEPGEEIRFILSRGDNLEPAQATTNILDEIVIRDTPGSPLNFSDYNRNITFIWDVGEFASMFNVRMRIHYNELKPGATEFEELSIDWILAERFEREDFGVSRVAFSFLSENFYRFLGETLDPDGSVRQITALDFLVTGVGPEFLELLEVANANIGITSAQSIPVYSNIEGGLGILTSRSFGQRAGMTLNSASVDSLQNGIYTRDLNFVP